MNLNQIKNRLSEIYTLVCETGVVTPPMRRELAELDKRADKLMDSASDHGEWKLCFDMRETIGEILNSEAALFA